MLLDILTEVRDAMMVLQEDASSEDMAGRKKAYLEVAFWCHGGKQRSVTAARLAEHVLKVYFGKHIIVSHTKHMMRPWWIWIPCQTQAREERSLLAYITLFVFNVHVSCSC
jgi:hypothetical protein